MADLKKLPIGVEYFKDFKSDNFYYVDKTGFISELLKTRGIVNLFTRPRRFGKSLNMDMLKAFFEIGMDASLFDGLDISKETTLCEKYMGKYPVISISLKDINGTSFVSALKTNEHLYFAVITGCLRIAKESIFTGLNNFKVRTISDVDCAEYFGFTDYEVKKMPQWNHTGKTAAAIRSYRISLKILPRLQSQKLKH